MYSVLEIGLRQLRADDDLNSIGAGQLKLPHSILNLSTQKVVYTV